MDADTLVATLQAAVPDAQIEGAPAVDPQTTIYVSRDDVPALARAVRDRPELAFDLLAELTAVDFWPKEPRYEVVYMLVSLGAMVYYPVPLHRQPPLAPASATPVPLDETERAATDVLALPIYPELTHEQQATVVAAVCAFYSA